MAPDIQVKILDKVLSFISTNNLWWQTYAILAFILLGYVLIWILASNLARKKIQLEITKHKLDHLKTLHDQGNLYNQQLAILNLQFSTLSDMLRKGNSHDEIRVLREEIIHHFSDQLCSSLDKYLDFYQEIKSKAECRDFYNDYIMKLLVEIESILITINLPVILENLTVAPFILSDVSLNRIRYFKNHSYPWFRVPTHYKYNTLIKKIKNAK